MLISSIITSHLRGKSSQIRKIINANAVEDPLGETVLHVVYVPGQSE